MTALPSDDAQRNRDENAMRLALDQAHNALLAGEVPVGAVILRDGKVIATGYNRPITTHDPTAHAESSPARARPDLQRMLRVRADGGAR